MIKAPWSLTFFLMISGRPKVKVPPETGKSPNFKVILETGSQTDEGRLSHRGGGNKH